MAKEILTINGVTAHYKHWVGVTNPRTGKPCKMTTIQDCMRRRRRGEYLTDIQCLWGKLEAPTEVELLDNNVGSFQAYHAELMEFHEKLFTKYFGTMAKAPTPAKPRIPPYNPYWSHPAKDEGVDHLSEEEVHDLNIPKEFHFFCLNSEDLPTILSLTQYYFDGGHEHLYALLQSKAIVKRFKLKDPSSFRTWNTLMQLANLCDDINVMALNKDRIIELALELGLNPAILPDIQCPPKNFPTHEQVEWWDILKDDVNLYPVTASDLIN
jgi:hypothetical protein